MKKKGSKMVDVGRIHSTCRVDVCPSWKCFSIIHVVIENQSMDAEIQSGEKSTGL